MKIYKKIVDAVAVFLQAVAAIMVGAMVLIICYQVAMRYFFNNPPAWTEEVSLQLMIYFCFICMMLGVKDEIHVAIELFMSKLPKKAFFVVELIDKILILVFGFCMGYFIIDYIVSPVLRGNKLPATDMPAIIQYIMPCIAGFVIVLIMVEKIILQIKEGTAGIDQSTEADKLLMEAEKVAAEVEKE